MRTSSTILWCSAALLGGLVLPLWLGLTDHPDVSVHSRPLRTHAGAIRTEASPGQTFQSGADGLHRIDVALVSLRPLGSALELVLRAENASGRILRRSTVNPGELATPDYVTFQFESIEDSRDRWFHFQLLPASGTDEAAHYSPWIRFHGQTGRDDPWGTESIESTAVRNYFQSPLSDLRALAVACEELKVGGDSIHFEIWDLDDGGATRRKVEFTAPAVIEGGYAFFSFAPIPRSKGRNYGYRIEAVDSMRFNGRFGKPTIKTLHGQDGATPKVRGMTFGERPFLDRDLCFRTWNSSGWSQGLQIAAHRAGWRFWAAAICWTLSILALARFFLGLRAWTSPGPAPNEESA